MTNSQIESLLDHYRVAVRATQRAEIDTRTCGTRRDYEEYRRALEAEETVREETVRALSLEGSAR